MENKRVIPDVYIDVFDSARNAMKGLAIYLNFKTDYKNNFGFILDKYNENIKSYFVSKKEIVDEADSEARLFIMDYGAIEYSFINVVEVRILDSIGIKKALEAYETWKYSATYHANYKENLEVALKSTERLENTGEFKNLRLECKAVPDCVEFTIIQPS